MKSVWLLTAFMQSPEKRYCLGIRSSCTPGPVLSLPFHYKSQYEHLIKVLPQWRKPSPHSPQHCSWLRSSATFGPWPSLVVHDFRLQSNACKIDGALQSSPAGCPSVTVAHITQEFMHDKLPHPPRDTLVHCSPAAACFVFLRRGPNFTLTRWKLVVSSNRLDHCIWWSTISIEVIDGFIL